MSELSMNLINCYFNLPVVRSANTDSQINIMRDIASKSFEQNTITIITYANYLINRAVQENKVTPENATYLSHTIQAIFDVTHIDEQRLIQKWNANAKSGSGTSWVLNLSLLRFLIFAQEKYSDLQLYKFIKQVNIPVSGRTWKDNGQATNVAKILLENRKYVNAQNQLCNYRDIQHFYEHNQSLLDSMAVTSSTGFSHSPIQAGISMPPATAPKSIDVPVVEHSKVTSREVLCQNILNLFCEKTKISKEKVELLLTFTKTEDLSLVHKFISGLAGLQMTESMVYVDESFITDQGDVCPGGWHPLSQIYYQVGYASKPTISAFQAKAESHYGPFLSWNGGRQYHDHMPMNEPSFKVKNPFNDELITVNSELYYQIHKCFFYYESLSDGSEKESIRDYIQKEIHNYLNLDPNKAKKIGQKKMPSFDTAKWENEVSKNVMNKAIFYKMTQNPAHCLELLATSMSASPLDYLNTDPTFGFVDWKEEKEATGENRLGKCLMDVRNQISAMDLQELSEILTTTKSIPSLSSIEPKKAVDKEMENKFNYEAVKLLLDFLNGQKGVNHRIKAGYKLSPSFQPFNLGQDLKLWLYINEISDSPFAEQKKRNYVINIETNDSYNYAKNLDTLRIHLDMNGHITKLIIGKNEVAVDQLFDPESIWNKRLTDAIRQFLMTNALSFQTHNGTITKAYVHPLILSLQPEFVLDKLCINNKFEMPEVTFLSSSLEASPSLDQDGTSKQFISDLTFNLFNGTWGRTIKMKKNAPILENDDPSQIKALLQFGKLLTYCFWNKGKVTGRILPDSFFKVLQTVKDDENLSYKKLLKGAYSMAEKEDKWMFSLILFGGKFGHGEEDKWIFYPQILDGKFGPSLTEEQESQIVDKLNLLNRKENPEAFDDSGRVKMESAREAAFCYLIAKYGPHVKAAYYISKGITVYSNTINSLNAGQLSTQIQGEEFSRQDIANRLKTYSSNPIVNQKVTWLKDFILHEQSIDWVKKLLLVVTGESAVTASTVIKIVSSPNLNSTASNKKLEIPEIHSSVGTDVNVSDKEKFLYDLNLALNQ